MNKLILIVAITLILFGLFLAVKPKQYQKNINQSASTKIIPTPVAKTFDLEVKNNKLISGPEALKVNQDDKVIIRITADTDGELHLHGYDQHIDFEKDKKAELLLTATISGRFPYELENTQTEIGALEVQPK